MSERMTESSSRSTVPRMGAATTSSTADRERTLHVGRDRESSLLVEGLIGSPILKIAGEVREMIARGDSICNLTVGDFAPSEFRVPQKLSEELTVAVAKGETNYPPSTGMP